LAQERSREMWGWNSLETLLQARNARGDYSYRNATIGSTRITRRAGR